MALEHATMNGKSGRSGGQSRLRDAGMKRDRDQSEEPIRVARRIFVGNLSYSTSWQDLKDHFREAGEVLFADVLRDDDNRSKGCGIVEFETAQQAADAINTLHDSTLNGREIFVREDREDFELLQRPESKQRRAVPITRLPGKQPREGRHQSGNAQQGVPGAKVFVNNLSWQTTWQTLKDHFNTQGLVAYAAVLTEPSGRSRGSGVVEFTTAAAAKEAIELQQGTSLDGRTIYVREYVQDGGRRE